MMIRHLRIDNFRGIPAYSSESARVIRRKAVIVR